MQKIERVILRKEISQEIKRLRMVCEKNSFIEPDLYSKYEVKRGLRDENGVGVLTGLTKVSDVCGSDIIDGKKVSRPGYLRYRGIDVNDIINDCIENKRFGFEEVIYLLLTGSLPDKVDMEGFLEQMRSFRRLPSTFVRDIIMKAASEDIMNTMQRSVLTLFSYDPVPTGIDMDNVMKQCLFLISVFPMIAVYGYQAGMYYNRHESFFIHHPKEEYSTAQNILHMLRPDSKFTELEAKVLDLLLILHAEHGGGNNSTFTMHVVSSTGTDTYAAVAAALSSLKGPKHGGANLKVVEMFDDIKENVENWEDAEEVKAYLKKILNKEAFDKSGLIYGVGHGVYTTSDPRAEIIKGFVEKLSKESGFEKEYALYKNVEEIAPGLVIEKYSADKNVCINIDFYSGFIYDMLGIPREMYTPLFAIGRIAGWSAHRLEEIVDGSKIIRPAYKNVKSEEEYIPYEER